MLNERANLSQEQKRQSRRGRAEEVEQKRLWALGKEVPGPRFLQQAWDVTRAVYYSNDFDRLSGGIVNDEVKAGRPEEHRLTRKVLSPVSKAWVLGDSLAGVENLQAERGGRLRCCSRRCKPRFREYHGRLRARV